MGAIVNGVKRRFHRDLASDPVTHGWMLNLYLGGERYPQRVCDYFQSEFAPSRQLAADLELHAKDEIKHGLLFAKGLRDLGQPEVEIPLGDVFNEVIRDFTPGTFHVVEQDSADAKRRKLAYFLAHAHFLEKRVARSFAYHLEACEAIGQVGVARIVTAILADEERHVTYTRQAVGDLLTRREATEILAVHQRAEAKANLVFSARQVRGFLARFPAKAPRHRRALYRLASYVMEGAGALV